MQSLDRALALLTVLAKQGSNGVPLKVLSESAAIHPSTAHHLLDTLLARGFVSQDQVTRHYRLGPGALTLAHQFLAQCDLAALGAPILSELHRQFDEWVILGVLEGGRIHNVIQLQSSQPLVINTGDGVSRGLHCTAIGKVVLAGMSTSEMETAIAVQGGLRRLTAYTITNLETLKGELERVRVQGYATNRQEQNEGMNAFAVPAQDLTGRVVAGIGVAMPLFRLTAARERAVISALKEAGRQLSAALGWEQRPPASAAERARPAGAPAALLAPRDGDPVDAGYVLGLHV